MSKSTTFTVETTCTGPYFAVTIRVGNDGIMYGHMTAAEWESFQSGLLPSATCEWIIKEEGE